MVEKTRADQSQRARWWEPFTFAAAAALVVAVLVLAWTPWPGGEFGRAPWWVWGPLVAAVVLLLVGVGERKYTVRAAAAGGAAMVAGVASFLTWPREEVVLNGRSHDRIRAQPEDVPPEWSLRLYPAEPPAAPLACALAAAAVLGLCVVMLVRRQDPWTPPEAEPGPGSGLVERERRDPIRPARRAMAAGLVGVLVGGLLGAGTTYGAGELQRQRMEALGPWWGPLAESAPVPEDRLHEGAVEWDRDDFVARVPERPTGVAWQHDFPGPVALGTCRRDGRIRATLVALEESAERSVIVGHDARDGDLRWSLTVHRRDTAELSQVAVGGGCSVLVLIGSVLLAVDTYTGQVVGSSVLPPEGLDAWHFIGPAQEESPPRLVGLREAQYAHLTSKAQGIVAVRRSDAELVARSDRSGDCAYLADYSGSERATGQLLVDRCSDRATVVNPPELAPPEELHTERPLAYVSRDRLPPLQPLLAEWETPVPAPPPGCSSRLLRIRSTTVVSTVVEAEMDCAGKKYWARISLSSDDIPRTPEWALSPEPDAGPDLTFVRSWFQYLLEVRGDAVTMLGPGNVDPWWSFVPVPGDPVVGLADSGVTRLLDGWVGPMDAGIYSPMLVLTHSGSLVVLAEFRTSEATERVRVIASSDVARQPCAGEQGLLADKASGTALVLCTMNGRTHVTAVTD
jgi:hypothetical protein